MIQFLYLGRYAGEIVKAFEYSETLVPAPLRALWDEYKAKMAEEGKTIKSSGGGFGGTGFKFDENEAAYTIEKKKFQKTVFGLQDSDDEDVEQEIDDTIEQLLDPKRSVKTVSASEAAAAGLITGGNVAPGTQVTESFYYAQIRILNINSRKMQYIIIRHRLKMIVFIDQRRLRGEV